MNDTTPDDSRPGGWESGTPPLPRNWLPEARPRADDPYWTEYTAQVMTALALAGGTGEPEGPGDSWTAEMGRRWRGATLLAAAAMAALLAIGIQDRTAVPVSSGTEDLALTLLAAEGDPAALWTRMGIPADPVLAWLTLEGASAHEERVP